MVWDCKFCKWSFISDIAISECTNPHSDSFGWQCIEQCKDGGEPCDYKTGDDDEI